MALADYSMPRAPDQSGVAKAIMSIGGDFTEMRQTAAKSQRQADQQLLQYELELKKIAAKHNLELAEIEARKQGDIERDREKDRRKYDQRDRDRAWIQEQMVGPENDPRYSDVVAADVGPDLVPNPQKYGEAKRKAGIAAHVIAGGAGNYDDYERGARTRQFSEQLENAPDLETQRRIRQAEKGDQRHRQGESGAQDDWGGKITPTDVSRSKVAENNAQANAANALANDRIAEAERKARTGGLTANDIYKQLSDLNQEETRVNTRLKEFQFDEEASAAERENLRRIQALREELRGELAKLRQPSGKQAKKSDAPYPDGTRLRGKDGKMYIVKNGKPVPEGK